MRKVGQFQDLINIIKNKIFSKIFGDIYKKIKIGFNLYKNYANNLLKF